jgi:hypothetical protein
MFQERGYTRSASLTRLTSRSTAGVATSLYSGQKPDSGNLAIDQISYPSASPPNLHHYQLKEMIDPNSVTNIELYQKVCIRYFGASERRILASDIQMGLCWNQNREGDQNRSGEA